jgi:hypothetical protein
MVVFRFESFGFGSIASPMRCSHATDLTRKLRTFSVSASPEGHFSCQSILPVPTTDRSIVT